MTGNKIQVRFFGGKHEKSWFDRTQLHALDLSEDVVKQRKSLAAKSAFTEVIDHIKNVKKRFGAEIVKKIMFNDDETTDETLEDVDDRAIDTR